MGRKLADRFFTGTAAANSANRTVTVSGVNWTTNSWAGYAIRRTSDVCNSGSISFSEILSNTSNTITYSDNGGYPTPPAMSFCAGDSLEIRKVVHALDQPGRALGSLITGTPPIRPTGWNNQVTEPCYSWNNTTGNAQVNFSAGPGVRANVHYFNNTPMPGYTPYVYPHPLVSGQAPPPPTPPPTPPPNTRCFNLQQRLNQLRQRRQQLQRRHRQNQQLNRKIRRLQQQLRAQHCN